jgi:DnaD/phage-associated family protein
VEELKTTLWVFDSLAQKRQYPRFVSLSEALADQGLRACFGAQAEEEIRRGLELAAQRGTLLRLTVEVEKDGRREETYWLNSPESRVAIERVKAGELLLTGLPRARVIEVPVEEPLSIFQLYEQELGVPLTPMIAEELKDAEVAYPRQWIVEAFKLAVERNKRQWRYIAGILRRWEQEGKDDGQSSRYPQTKDSPYKRVKFLERYRHILKR